MLGIGVASLLSDWSHEIATTLMPAFLASMGVAAAWLGLIEGVSDGLSSFAKLGSGYYTDKLRRRKPVAVAGYIITALGTASFGLANAAWQVLLARATAWLGRGVRTPVRKALLAASVTRDTYGRAFGFERMMDTLGAVEERLEGSLCAELVEDAHHGMAFGVLATVNGAGDSISSVVVGGLWTALGTGPAFGYSALLFLAGSVLVLRLGRSGIGSGPKVGAGEVSQ